MPTRQGYAEGAGTVTTNYKIQTPEQYELFRQQVEEGGKKQNQDKSLIYVGQTLIMSMTLLAEIPDKN